MTAIEPMFKRSEFKTQKCNDVHTLVNTFDFTLEQAVTIAEHQIDNVIAERLNAQSRVKYGAFNEKKDSGKANIKSTVPVTGIPAKLGRAMTYAEEASKNGLSLADCTFVLSDDIKAYIAELEPRKAK